MKTTTGLMLAVLCAGSVSAARLGVNAVPKPAWASPDTPDGVLITHVEPGGIAELAGIAVGDLLLSIDDQPIDSAAALRERLALVRPGDRLRLEVLRDEPRTLKVVVPETADEAIIEPLGVPDLDLEAEPDLDPAEGPVVDEPAVEELAPADDIDDEPVRRAPRRSSVETENYRQLSITDDNGHCTLRARWSEDGEPRSFTCTGTRTEIRSAITRLPESLQRDARSQLDVCSQFGMGGEFGLRPLRDFPRPDWADDPFDFDFDIPAPSGGDVRRRSRSWSYDSTW